MAISELVLVELYLHLRNPAVFQQPCSEAEAVEICQHFRGSPKWRLIESADVMDDVWPLAAQPGFARRRIIDARLAMTLRLPWCRRVRDGQHQGLRRLWVYPRVEPALTGLPVPRWLCSRPLRAIRSRQAEVVPACVGVGRFGRSTKFTLRKSSSTVTSMTVSDAFTNCRPAGTTGRTM